MPTEASAPPFVFLGRVQLVVHFRYEVLLSEFIAGVEVLLE